MTYSDDRDKLRRAAESERKAAQARAEHDKQRRADIGALAEKQQQRFADRQVSQKEREIASVQDRLGIMDRLERKTRRELGIKQSSEKRSDIRRVREEAGTLRKRQGEEKRLEFLKKQLGTLKGGTMNRNSSTPRPPGGGLIR